jgi:hypothetical protein
MDLRRVGTVWLKREKSFVIYEHTEAEPNRGYLVFSKPTPIVSPAEFYTLAKYTMYQPPYQHNSSPHFKLLVSIRRESTAAHSVNLIASQPIPTN